MAGHDRHATPGPPAHKQRPHRASFRFYAELGDFLPPGRRGRSFTYTFHGRPAVKDAIEALGVPHTEVDLVLLNGESVGFEQPLSDGDRVSVYPVFESLDISMVTCVRPQPLRQPLFVADCHLGTLARYLRLLGFDTLFGVEDDAALARLSKSERRVLLTRDRGLLKRNIVTHGYWVRQTQPGQQLVEVVRRLDLVDQAKPFSRCLACNGILRSVPAGAVRHLVPIRVGQRYAQFKQCRTCGRVYWQGSHYTRLARLVEETIAAARE